MRLFVAVDMPERVKERLAKMIAELRACGADVRWVHTASLHLTLKFLGNVEPKEVGPIDETLSRVAAAAASTRGRLRGVGSFPHLRRPRVVWVGVEADGLAALHDAVESSLAELGFAVEKRRFHAHVTLGRVRGGKRLEELAAAVQARGDAACGSFPIEALTLFESRLGRGGARYTAVSTHPLSINV